MLSAVAVETGRYIIGGSMPERDPADDNRVYNTLTVWDPQGRLVTKFRKLHLYDVNIPGGIVFTESEAIGPGSKTAVVKFRECGSDHLSSCR
jgi:predicted amidohydrolase